MKINFNVKPKRFQILIQNCGTDSFNGSYKRIDNTNPILLGKQVANIMGNDFAGKQYSSHFKYYLACILLKELEFDKNNLFEDINSINEKIKRLDLKQKSKTSSGKVQK